MNERPNIALVPIEEDIDVTTAGALRVTLDRLINNGCRRIILNMSGASYVDSAGMATILVEIRRMRKLGGLISLTNVSDQVLAIMRRARLVDFVPVSSVGSNDAPDAYDPQAQPLWRTVVPVDSNNLAHTRASVSRLLARVPLSPDERFDANLAVGEAMGNAVDHTSGEGATITVAGYEDRVVVEVSDLGEGFDPNAVDEREAGSFEERGRGIKLMRLLADSVSISQRPSGTGMLVRIVKVAHATTD
jgi:anti-anti-sigma factor